MFGLIRRLSYSVIPRPDRPWEDDPTSNAPHKPRKRRLSSSEQEDAIPNRQDPSSSPRYAGESATKRARGEGASLSSPVGVDEFGGWSVPPDSQPSVQDLTPPDSAVEPRHEQEPETQDVKEVTQGVKEVELEDKVEKTETRHDPVDNQEEEAPEKTVDAEVHPERVPLPDEDHVDELDDEESGESSSNTGNETEATAEQTTAVDSEKQEAGATRPEQSYTSKDI